MPVTMRGPNGETIPADESEVQFWINQGFSPITDEQIGAEITARAAQPEDRGVIGDVNAAVTSALGGATVGLSDVLLGGIMNRGQRERLVGDIEHAPIVSTAARLVGEVAPAIVAPGSLLSRAPAGKLGRLAIEAGEKIGGTGAAARVARMAATGAVEGSVSNAGQYLGAMALQDKDVSAEGFLASMQDGALYGGGAAGALGIAGEGLVAARRLIPETELTPVAVRRAREAAKTEVSAAVSESTELIAAGRKRARVYREQAIQANPALQAELDQIAIARAREIADAETAAARAKTAKAEADAAAAQSRAEAAATRAEKAKQPRKNRKKTEPEAQAGEPEAAAAPDGPAVEIPPPATADDPDALMRQLQDTKSALDSGTPLDALSARRVEDAINRRVAQESPEMERLLRHLDGLSGARDQVASWLDKRPGGKVKAFEYTEGMRKQSGWRDVLPMDSQRPGFTEGSLATPRGRQGEFRGTEAERQSFERKVERKDLHRRIEDPLASAEEKLAAQQRLDEMNAASAARKAGIPTADDAQATAMEIVSASDDAVVPSVDKHVGEALAGHADLADDVDDATEAIGNLEQSTADLADELGLEAPPMAQERARAYRESQQSSEDAAAQATDGAIADAEQAAKTIGLGATPQARKASGMLARAENAGQMLEALQLLGVPVPDASRIPVIGPMLSLYLKAKLAHRAVRGLGGKVSRTAETEIAHRANDTKAKLMRAADHAIGAGGRALTSTTAARAAGAGAASVLGAKLFDDRDPGTKEPKPSKDLAEIYLARKEEIDRAAAPGAVRESIRKRVRTADAPLLDAIVAAEERKLKFLASKMPRVDDGVQLLGKKQRVPARSDIEQWSKYVAAAQRPAETIGAILAGELTSAEAAETIRVVAPRLLQEVQTRIVEKATESDVDIGHRKRVHLSTMLGIPLDDTQSPEAAQFYGLLYEPKVQPSAQPMPSGPADYRAAERIAPETRI